MSFDAAAIRARFPILATRPGGRPLHYLDSAATAQLPDLVLDAVREHETTSRANIHRGNHTLSDRATEAWEAARATVARYIGAATPEEVIFTSGATGALNLAARTLGETLSAGDEIVLSRLEHHSNLVPWQQLRDRSGVVLREIPVTAEGRLDTAALDGIVTDRCRLVAVTHCSNVTGAITDVANLVAAARAVGAAVLLDGAQRTPHGPLDVAALDVDFYAFSGHKTFGPNGIGVLWGRAGRLAALPPFMTGGHMIDKVTWDGATWAEPPWRFEAGTPPIAQAVGMAAALDWLMTLDWDAVHSHTRRLLSRLLQGVAGLPGVGILGPPNVVERAPVLSLTTPGLPPAEVCHWLDTHHGVALRGGAHCAQPLMQAFDVPGTTRASIALYNDESDIDALLDGLRALLGGRDAGP